MDHHHHYGENVGYGPAANSPLNSYVLPAANAPYAMPNATLGTSKAYPVASAAGRSDAAAILVLFILLVIISRMGHDFYKKC